MRYHACDHSESAQTRTSSCTRPWSCGHRRLTRCTDYQSPQHLRLRDAQQVLCAERSQWRYAYPKRQLTGPSCGWTQLHNNLMFTTLAWRHNCKRTDADTNTGSNVPDIYNQKLKHGSTKFYRLVLDLCNLNSISFTFITTVRLHMNRYNHDPVTIQAQCCFTLWTGHMVNSGRYHGHLFHEPEIGPQWFFPSTWFTPKSAKENTTN